MGVTGAIENKVLFFERHCLPLQKLIEASLMEESPLMKNNLAPLGNQVHPTVVIKTLINSIFPLFTRFRIQYIRSYLLQCELESINMALRRSGSNPSSSLRRNVTEERDGKAGDCFSDGRKDALGSLPNLQLKCKCTPYDSELEWFKDLVLSLEVSGSM
ncbi:hypothetical protein F2Q69_00036810 [Brassica cretica]|uniref:Uncharacterized protein n=1 Tax=Brassica cretica TaxID=69181 RepID=A0A8S9SMA0_BRACR|nr:hypothetical protein F2Q69_00036810 [Brassica cretica]